ncbi:MAG: DUF1284 domain-containing protein [Candidatus Nanoarchaeia archaeon]|nr:DUF1284 domain-containing protein [Candidatus Nanoarchaeia archaeon]
MAIEQRILRLRPHHVEKLLWKSLMWTEGALGAEAMMHGYNYEFYEKTCDTMKELLNTECTIEIVSTLDDLCNACKDKEDFGCNLPETGEEDEFYNAIGLQMGHKYANWFLLGKIRHYAKEKHAETGDALARAKYNFLDSVISTIERSKVKQSNGGN